MTTDLSRDIVRLFICGDFCSTPSASFISMSHDLTSLIDSCDLKICNFEGPVKSDGEKLDKIPPNILQSPDVPDFLENVGFNVISLANNHTFDYGEEGYLATRKAFRKARVIGVGSFEEAYRVEMFEVNGIRIGLLALTYASFGVFEGEGRLGEWNVGCAEMDHLCVNHLIMNAKSKVDYLFVYLHDGIEYIDIPLPEQRERYRDFIDYGVDGVIVHHAHVPQGWEVYKEKPIFYNLGNFFFNSKETPDFHASKRFWYNGLAVVLEVGGLDKTIRFRVYNILNNRNREICLDSSPEIVVHATKICDILQEDEIYYQEVLRITKGLWRTKYVTGMTFSLLSVALRTDFIHCLSSIVKAFLRNNPKLIYSYIRNKNHRNNVIRLIKLSHNYR